MLSAVLEHDRAAVLQGDGVAISTLVGENTIDALVTDPPSGISFMGKAWDDDKGGRDKWIAWLRDRLVAAYRVLKPGAHGLVWALPRTSHWTATACEDAGFEIRDVVMHVFGTGFPKSLTSKSAPIPVGTGSALKPAAEHWILVRKPLEGTYGDNFAKYGTGVIQIDACRIGTEGGGTTCEYHDRGVKCEGHGGNVTMNETYHGECPPPDEIKGRWPSHLVLSHSDHCVTEDDVDGVQYVESRCADGCPVLLLDEQSGELKSGKKNGGKYKRAAGVHGGGQRGDGTASYGDKGGASRFFYVAKGARKEKDEGLDHLPIKTGGEATGRAEGSKGTQNARAGAGRTGGARNHHPTVKGVDLMRYLVRLVTPPGGTVLDLFAGSGTTGVAALAEGCSFIGCELGGENGEYIPIITGRINHALSKYVSGNKGAA